MQQTVTVQRLHTEGQQEEKKKIPVLELLKRHCRVKHLSYSTEKTYCGWVKAFWEFFQKDGKRSLYDMGRPEVEAYLTYLAVKRNVSASTQIMNRGCAVRSPIDRLGING